MASKSLGHEEMTLLRRTCHVAPVQIHHRVEGKIILTSLNLLAHVNSNALAGKLRCNLVNYAERGLHLESARFEWEGCEARCAIS